MKKAKRNAVLILVIFALLTAGAVYAVLEGLGKDYIGRAKDIPLGLDLQGGVSVTYEVLETDATEEEIKTTIDKLQRRVDTYSPDAEVYQQGKRRIVAEIPVDTSKYDPNEILDSLGRPGKLEFIDPTNYEKFAAGEEYEAALTGSDVKNAQGGRYQENTGEDEYVVSLQLNDEGAVKFSDVTGANVGNPIYIVYDGNVVSAPTVREQISGGSAQIDGMADYEEASELANTIKIGALPLTLSELSSQIVGAKLGSDALRTSLIAGAIGLCLIFLLMIVIFRFPGFLSAVALSVYAVLELFFLNALHITLTLPGLAGIILSIGMAVDANVIIFTRIKEEIGAGKTVKTAVKAGFEKAMSAIIDGNITTIIAGVVLLLMGTGTVKGFARTLILGIILSMFTALVITRLLLNACVNLGLVNKKLYGAAKQPKITKYTKGFRYAGTFSAIIIVAALAFLFINKGTATRGNTLNFSLEFSGGTSTSVTFNEAMTLQQAEEKVLPVFDEVGIDSSKVQIQVVDNTNQVVFKTNSLDESKRSELADKLKETFSITDDKIDSENISSTISQETQRDAILAVVIASILMLIYIAVRFNDVRFGASAVLALIHDVMFVFFAYAALYLTVGGTFIACMLTIVGYSINSSIIIFDRIRENLKVMSVDKVGYDEIVNTSISQTFTRNIYTNLTTFITILMLNILGVPSLKEFTFTLMVGVVAGTYSSICITGPLWLWLRKHVVKKEAAVEKK
ncbi:MAG: protein translocase subunit SecD [Eubacterium sp.]|nr:protein translocase subunit SecD [Eubacterium sp.]